MIAATTIQKPIVVHSAGGNVVIVIVIDFEASKITSVSFAFAVIIVSQ